MRNRTAAVVFGAVLATTAAVAADEGYGFQFTNASGGPATIVVDGKTVCVMAAGGHCSVTVKADDHDYAYTLGAGAPVSFSVGNPEMADQCKIDASGAHCVDTLGHATN